MVSVVIFCVNWSFDLASVRKEYIQQKGSQMFKLAVALTAILALAACETTKGVGRDVQNAGEALENAAE